MMMTPVTNSRRKRQKFSYRIFACKISCHHYYARRCIAVIGNLCVVGCCSGIIFARYDSTFKAHRQLCLSVLKRFGYGQSVMETRIMMEVEEMIQRVREEQGRPFDMKELTTSCVANVVMNMMFGRRFDHSDPAFQQLISDYDDIATNLNSALLLFPVLRFLAYFNKKFAKCVRCVKNTDNFINSQISACTEVCNHNTNTLSLCDSDCDCDCDLFALNND